MHGTPNGVLTHGLNRYKKRVWCACCRLFNGIHLVYSSRQLAVTGRFGLKPGASAYAVPVMVTDAAE